MITGFQSIKTIISKLYRDLGGSVDINESNLIEWVAECLLKIGAYGQYEEIKTCLTLTDGKAQLPCNFYKLKDIAYKGQPMSWASQGMLTYYGCDNCHIQTCCSNYQFYINNNYLITDIRDTDSTTETDICLVYLGIPVDDEGYPLVPDNVYYSEACAKYVTYMLDYREWRKGGISDKVFDKSEKDYLFYINSARGSANMPNAHQLENLKNTWVRLIPKQNELNNFFKNNSNPERRKRF